MLLLQGVRVGIFRFGHFLDLLSEYRDLLPLAVHLALKHFLFRFELLGCCGVLVHLCRIADILRIGEGHFVVDLFERSDIVGGTVGLKPETDLLDMFARQSFRLLPLKRKSSTAKATELHSQTFANYSSMNCTRNGFVFP